MVRLRSAEILRSMSPRSLLRLLSGALRAPWDQEFAGHPVAACWFTNFTCNARCPFCCKSDEINAGSARFPVLGLPEAKRLLKKIRRSVGMLYISGGEPLLHPAMPEIVQEAKALGFGLVGMSTNLIIADKRPDALVGVDVLAVSLHAATPERHARQLGVSAELGGRVFANLEALAQRRGAAENNMAIVVNCVVTPDNVKEVMPLLDYTGERGFLLEVVPVNADGAVAKGLPALREYRQLIDNLLASRRSGRAPHLGGSGRYYRTIRDLRPFRCFPYGVPNIMPDGRLCTPCDVAAQYSVNVLDHEDLDAALKASFPLPAGYPCREGRCFKAGIVERSLLYGFLTPRPESVSDTG